MKNAFTNPNLSLFLLQSAEAATDLHNPSSEQTRFKSEASTWSCKARPSKEWMYTSPQGHATTQILVNLGMMLQLKSNFCSHSQKRASPQDHFPVRMKQHSINCFKSLPRSIRTDLVKTRSWASRATLQKSPLNTTPHSGPSKGCRCICISSWEQAGSVTLNAFNWEGKFN